MGLEIGASLCVAAFIILFKVFELRRIALLPAIAINYLTAFVCGLAYSKPWAAGDISLLWWPSFGLGALFVCVFFLTGLSAQRAGVTRTTVAGRISLVITVLVTASIFHEPPGMLAWAGIALALIGLALNSWRSDDRAGDGAWFLPLLIFIGSAACDISVNALQRTRTTSLTEAVFPTVCFGFASIVSMGVLLMRAERASLRDPRVWIGGTLLGVVNYASLVLLVAALAHSGMPASGVFPLMNIGAILFATIASLLLFRERLSILRWIGIAICVIALSLIMVARA